MSLTESQDGAEVYFVIPEEYSDEEDCSPDMKLAFQNCMEHGLCPEWISEAACLKLEPMKTDVFVCETFEGHAFTFLKNFKCVRIVGPRCILACLIDGTSIPDGQSPVFTVAMRGLVVTTTNFDNVELKNSLGEKIQYMGGVYTNKLRQSITHLVANNVCSMKYTKAVELGVPIMTAEWVLSVWEDSKERNILATDPEYMTHRCPVFHGLIITCSGLPRKEKDTLREKITSHGGEFCGQLESERTHMLVTNDSTGDKYKYAILWELPCVLPAWVDDSIKNGHALPTESYHVKNTSRGCSTPESNQSKIPLNFSTVSSITNQDYCSRVDETLMNCTVSSTSVRTSMKPPVKQTVVTKAFDMVDKLDLKEAKKAGVFLDGCNVYLSGFSPDRTEKLRRVLNGGGAIRFNEISESVSHVIVGDFVPVDVKLLKTSGYRPHVVTVEWLLESIKQRCPASEESFSCFDLLPAPAEPPSPLSKKGVHLLQRLSDHPVRHLDMDASLNTENTMGPPNSPDKTLVQQYLQASEADISVQNVTTTKLAKCPELPTDTGEQSNQNNEDSTQLSTLTDATSIIFHGLTFTIAGFDEESRSELEETIQYCGGQLVKRNFKGIPDYGVVPLSGSRLFHTTREIVTHLWLQCCYDEEKLLPVQYYHQPVSFDLSLKPLQGCVIGLTTYTGKERIFITELSNALGALTQEMFAKVDNDAKGAKASTHLICPKPPSGSKYNAAVKWNLPAVTHEWLLACAREGKRASEDPYSVKENSSLSSGNASKVTSTTQRQDCVLSTSSENSVKLDQNVMGPPSAPVTPGTPAVHAKCGENTPNRWPYDANQTTPKPPGYISTPETPYGQVFKPDPSPNTRKQWKRWIDNFPEFPQDEPVLKKRRQSTPLSELKRQCWTKFGGIKYSDPTHTPDQSTEEVEPSRENIQSEASKGSNNNLFTSTEDDQHSVSATHSGGSSSAGINTQLVELNEILTTASKPEETMKGNGTSAAGDKKTASAPESLDVNADFVEWVDPVVSNESSQESRHEDEKYPLKFMLSALEEREHYEKIILSLGGAVTDMPNFDPSASHLVCNRPARSEKLLASIASGKWILHKSFLDESEQAGHFLEEEPFEWGNPQAPGLMRSLKVGTTDYLLAKSAHRWRCKLSGTSSGAFTGMEAIILTNKEKMESFKRLIIAGGGNVLNIRPPFDNTGEATLCLIEMNKVKQPINLAALVENNVPCVLPIFLNNLLIMEPTPDPHDSVIPEYRTLLKSK